MVILFGNQDTVAGKTLSFKPSVVIGRISYSLYLWHFSVFALARLYLNTEPSKILYAFLIAVVFPISYLSYRFVETPFRDKTKFSRMSIFAASLCGVMLFVSLGYNGHQNNGMQDLKLKVSEKGLILIDDNINYKAAIKPSF